MIHHSNQFLFVIIENSIFRCQKAKTKRQSLLIKCYTSVIYNIKKGETDDSI